MIMSKRRKFERKLGNRCYKKLFVLAVEGGKTEPEYFSFFNCNQSTIHVECISKGNKSAPFYVLKQLENRLRDKGLKSSDEAWVVVDKDKWTGEQLNGLYRWSKSEKNYGFALSNPNFEYWLLLHFEDGNGISSSKDCEVQLKKYLPDYNKAIEKGEITCEMIKNAVNRAKARDNPSCIDWPRNPGCTTVYKLVEKILSAG